MDNLKPAIGIFFKYLGAATFFAVLKNFGVFGFGESDQVDQIFGIATLELLVRDILDALALVQLNPALFRVSEESCKAE